MRPSSQLGLAVALGIVASQDLQSPLSAQAHQNPYRIVDGWAQLPGGRPMGAVGKVAIDRDGQHVWAIVRCDRLEDPARFGDECRDSKTDPILRFGPDGRVVKSFGGGMFIWPHGLDVDRDGNVWVTDAVAENRTPKGDKRGQIVVKFSPEGKVLMTLGKAGVSGSGPDLFDQPTDVLVAPSGDIFVTDSHRNGKNNRVVKFTREGRFVKEWGSKGSGRGELSEPHTIAMDSRGRLFVGDRENNRIQIFDQDGRVLDEWRQFGRPSGIFITKDDTIYVADSESGPDTGAHELSGIKKGIRIGSAKTGEVRAFIEDMESTAPDHSGAEGVGVDARGNVYGAVVRRQMLERHVR